MPSRRAAVFVVSPIAVYSSRREDPTLPDITSPELSPMPIVKASPCPSSASQALNRARRSPAISRAAASARSPWSACSSGAPKTAMIPSPMYATSVPPLSRMASLIDSR